MHNENLNTVNIVVCYSNIAINNPHLQFINKIGTNKIFQNNTIGKTNEKQCLTTSTLC